MKLIFLGPPGAGKGTQAERVAARFGLAHISTGDMLRAEMRAGTPLGKAAKGFVDQGALVPDDVILGMVAERVKQPDCEKGYLFDGFPRTLAQAEALTQIADVDCVVNIEVPAERIVSRISGRRMCAGCGAAYHVSTHAGETCGKCGAPLYQRDDDKSETVANRLRVYEAQTQPLIAYYAEKALLRSVDGDQRIELVEQAIADVLPEN